MSDPEAVTLPGGKIQFYDYYQPRLQAGKYQINARQIIEQEGDSDYTLERKVYETRRTFHVTAPRFRLGPSDVHAVFPPGNSRGDFDQTLSHVVLRRRTLPWERQLDENGAGAPVPWLALLLFNASDFEGASAPARVLRPLSEVIDPAEPDISGPDLVLNEEIDDPSGDAQGYTIDIPLELFSRIAPRLEELTLLAHVRQVHTGDKELLGLEQDGWFSVVISNRLPKTGQINTAHLVSLEGWQTRLPGADTSASAGDKKQVRLVSLASWSFSAIEERGSFKELMEELDVGLLAAPLPERLEEQDSPAAKLVSQAVKSGYVPLNYETRLGEKTAGWYRSPLLPVHVERVDKDPYESAEAALIYDPRTGLFDASYAVAWQIGRLLALSDGSFAAALQAWRQEGHQLLDQMLEILQVAAQFGDVGQFALPNMDQNDELLTQLQEFARDPTQEEELLTRLREYARDPKLMSSLLANHVLKGTLIERLILPEDQVAALKAAMVDKSALTASLRSLTPEQIEQIHTLRPGLRAEHIRNLLEGVA